MDLVALAPKNLIGKLHHTAAFGCFYNQKKGSNSHRAMTVFLKPKAVLLKTKKIKRGNS
jgi:hypothetical protein